MSADKKVQTCPACSRQTLVSHCGDEHPTCTWHTCRHSHCAAVVDLAQGHGHGLTPDGLRNVTFGGEAS